MNSNTLLRVHSLGKRKLGVQGSAYYFMRISGLPESKELEARTLDKLAQAPWIAYGNAAAAPAQSVFLRPALNDILREETFFELRQPPGQPAQVALAVHLPENRAGEWFTNLAGAAQLLTGLAPQSSVQDPRSWSLRQPRSPALLELKRVGNWTVVGAAETQNQLFEEIVARIQNDQRPAPPLQQWLNADVDLPRLARAIGLENPALQGLPRLSLSLTGDGARVLTSAQLVYPQPLPEHMEPWTVPADLIHEPLTSFTAIRGVKSWLPSFQLWNTLQLGQPPDQLYFWAREGGSFQTFLAAPLPDASARVQSFSDRLINHGNSWLAQRGYIAFERWPDGNGVGWGNMPDFRPFIRSAGSGDASFILAGLVPESGPSTNPAPLETLLQPMQTNASLVYYDWEDTSRRVEPWLFISQNARTLSRRAQLPMDALGTSWLGAMIPRLDTSETLLTQTSSNQLSLSRQSTTGFTAPELHLLVDWLESPLFPRGLYSLLVSSIPPPADRP